MPVDRLILDDDVVGGQQKQSPEEGLPEGGPIPLHRDTNRMPYCCPRSACSTCRLATLLTRAALDWRLFSSWHRPCPVDSPRSCLLIYTISIHRCSACSPGQPSTGAFFLLGIARVSSIPPARLSLHSHHLSIHRCSILGATTATSTNLRSLRRYSF